MSTPAIALDQAFTSANVASAAGLPVAQQTIQIVEVTAPATLEAGYTFEAVYNDEVITVTVPAGGVKVGQRIEVPYKPTITMVYAEPIAIPLMIQSTSPETIAETPPYNYTDNSTSTTARLLTPQETLSSNDDVPIGYWKDGLFDCFKYGCCHMSVFCSMCFPRIMIAQILNRMKMTISGNNATSTGGNGSEWKNNPYQQMWIIVISFFVFKWFFGCPSFYISLIINNDNYGGNLFIDGGNPFSGGGNPFSNGSYDPNDHTKDTDDQFYSVFDPHCARGKSMINTMVTIMMGLYSFFILVKLRRAVRRKYRIPTGQACSLYCCFHCFHPQEDYCLSFWFPCCTIAQLARQTANYDTNQADCCSNDGLLQHDDV